MGLVKVLVPLIMGHAFRCCILGVGCCGFGCSETSLGISSFGWSTESIAFPSKALYIFWSHDSFRF